jgi:hypothetical protein
VTMVRRIRSRVSGWNDEGELKKIEDLWIV